MSFQDVMREIGEFLATPLYTIGDTEGTVGTTLTVAFMVLVTWWLSRLVSQAILRAFKRRGASDQNAVRPYARSAQILVLIVGLSAALNTLGFKLTALFAAGGLFAVAIGFAMKNIVENFVSGLIMRIEKSIKRGDILKVEGQVVTVKDVGVRFTLAQNRDNEDLLIPNSILMQSMVTNRTLSDALFRLRAPVGVVYSSDMPLVKETLMTAATGLTWRSDKMDPVVIMRAFGSSSVDFEVSVWLEDPWSIGQYISGLNEAIWWSLKEAGIVIAFPQLDVHFDEPLVESLQSLRGTG
jgi:small-conductance mechanosensitive channel